MATLPPPPSKKQKTAAADKAREQQDVDIIPLGMGHVRVRFFDESTGKSIGDTISIPVADTTTKNLEVLVNSLLGNQNAAERIPYKFSLIDRPTEKSPVESDRHVVRDIYHSVIEPKLKSTEETINLQCKPQAVFHVKSVSRCSSSIPGHDAAILAAQFSPANSSKLLTGSGDATARLWDCDTGTPQYTLKGHTSWVLVVSWSPDASMISTGSMDNTVRLWDPNNGQPLGGPLKGHTKWVRSIAWEPYHLQALGKPRLASASKDSTIRIWDAMSRRIESVLSGHKASVSCVRWGGLGRLYTSSQDKTIKIWDANQGTLVSTLTAHAHWVNHLALSTDFVLRTAFYDHTGTAPTTEEGKVAKAKDRFLKASSINNEVVERLISASDDLTIYLWDPSAGTKPITRLLGHQKQVNHVTFSPDGRLIASAAFDNHIKLWNAADGKFIFTLRGHVGPVYMTCFSADSRLLVSGSKDTTLKIWDCSSGKLKEDLTGHHQDEIYAVDWSPSDGQKVGSGGKDKAVKLWRH